MTLQKCAAKQYRLCQWWDEQPGEVCEKGSEDSHQRKPKFLYVWLIFYLLENEDKLLIVQSLQLPPLIEDMLAQNKPDSLQLQDVEDMLVMKVSKIGSSHIFSIFLLQQIARQKPKMRVKERTKQAKEKYEQKISNYY